MTDDTMDLRSVLEKTGDIDLLREMTGFGARRLMELEVENLTGAPHGARVWDASASDLRWMLPERPSSGTAAPLILLPLPPDHRTICTRHGAVEHPNQVGRLAAFGRKREQRSLDRQAQAP